MGQPATNKYIDAYKELGLKIHQEAGGFAVALCPFHGDKKDPSLIISKDTGAHRCFQYACAAYIPGDINAYTDLLFGRTPKRESVRAGDKTLNSINAETRESIKKAIRQAEGVLRVELAESGQSHLIGREISFKATSAGKDLQPYASPSKLTLKCKMGLKICGACSIGNAGGKLEHEIKANSLDVLRMIDCNEEQQKEFLRKTTGVYPRCPRFEVQVDEHYTIEDIRLMPEISFNSSPDAEYTIKQAYHVGHGIKTNRTYNFEGIPVPDPKDQHVTYLLNRATPVQDSLESFKLTEEEFKQLKIFQIRRATDSIADKIDDITNDLSTNVTHIYQRNDLITAIDLVYHSVLRFKFQGKVLTKGWTEALIIGDTRCGKTETITKLIGHYRAGEVSTGENCSFAGLIGGLQQIGSRWSITWGKLALNDKRLFVIDELSGMPVEDIGKMSGVRSSGIAEITKVQSEKTFARTRLIWVSNPRSSRALGTYDTGVQAIPELMGRPEDTARFDLAITVMSGDVPATVVNRLEPPRLEHKFTSDLCNKLVTWAWSRKAEDVQFTKEAEKLCLELSTLMGQRYSSQIPLVEPAEFRIKLARLSVACAARLFSTTDGVNLIVDACHIQFVYDFLNKIYSASSMNYLAYSKARMLEQQLKNEEEVSIVVKSHGPSLVEGLLAQQYFRLQDFEDLFDLEKKELKSIVSQLVRNRAIKHYNTVYVKTPAFITLLRKVQANGVDEKPKPAEADY